MDRADLEFRGRKDINRSASSVSFLGSKMPRLATLSTILANLRRPASTASARELTLGAI